MNREILFRGKRIDNGEWIFGDLIQWNIDESKWILPIESIDLTSNIKVDQETIGQYSGLKDKNGVKIFEGDICLANGWKSDLKHDFSSARRYVDPSIKDIYERKENRTKYEVFWQQCFSQFDFKSLEDSQINPSITERDLEVIGNIYDDKEIKSDS